IDGPGSHDAAAGVDLPCPPTRDAAAHAGHAPVLDTHIGLVARHPSAIHDRSATDHEIELGHAPSSLDLRVLLPRRWLILPHAIPGGGGGVGGQNDPPAGAISPPPPPASCGRSRGTW